MNDAEERKRSSEASSATRGREGSERAANPS